MSEVVTCAIRKLAIHGFLILGCIIAGCKKRETASQTPSTESTPVAIAPEEAAKIESQFSAPTIKSSGATIEERLNGAVHPELTTRLRMFVNLYGRMPESVHEFANATGDGLPSIPDTMKYVIDPADKTVKVVRK